MGAKKKRSNTAADEAEDPMDSSDAIEDSSDSSDCNEGETPTTTTSAAPSSSSSQKINPMESKKKRKAMDKDKHRQHIKSDELPKKPKVEEQQSVTERSGMPELHVGAFRDLSSADSSVREAAAEALARELREVQSAYERSGGKKEREITGIPQLQAEEKDDGLENCAPSLRYALRRLIRGVSSSRECARQGFATALGIVLETIYAIRVNEVIKLILELLEVSSSMKGQEARDGLLGRLFAFGALAKSGRMTAEWISDNNTPCFEDFIRYVISLAGKKQYLQNPAVLIILESLNKLPVEVLKNHALKSQSLCNWFKKAANEKIPDALFLMLKLQERVPLESDMTGGLLPQPFSPDNFFSREHLSHLIPCFQETTFCQPHVHSLWPVLANFLIPTVSSKDDCRIYSSTSKKHKKSKKGSFPEDITKNVRCFNEVVIEGSLITSSHDRKHLAFDILLLLLPRLPACCIYIVLSYKLVQCLMDILSTKSAWLHNTAQHFLRELISWVGDDSDRMVSVLVSLQKHSNGRFDCITRTHTVKELVAKVKAGSACLTFVDRLIDLFVDEGGLTDELSDQSQTTDDNSEKGSNEDSQLLSGNPEFLKSWIVETLPRVLKNLNMGTTVKSWAPEDMKAFVDEKFQLQTKIMKFLTVQGLFSASLGTEVTSFELQEKFKWPKKASSTSLRRLCVEQLQTVMEDAQKGDGPNLPCIAREQYDLGSYFIHILQTLCSIPSVSLFRILSTEDEEVFKKLQEVETKLFHEERDTEPGSDADKLHAVRYLLIQLLLQVLLQPGQFFDAASELVMCCEKAFPGVVKNDLQEEDPSGDNNDVPNMMDVLVDTLLSLLPQSSGQMSFAIGQVFRRFCSETTNSGLLVMLRVIKKDLKPLRHQPVDSDDDDDEDDDEDLLGVEDAEDTSDIETAETAEDYMDEGDEQLGLEGTNDHEEEMDDEAMFRMDSYITQFLKKSGKSGKDSAASQLMNFKLRILSLLEIYLQKNPGKPQVFTIFAHLARAYVNYHAADGCKQLGERIWGILQKKIFKAKEYPKGNEIDLPTLQNVLRKSLKSASRTRFKSVSLLAKSSTFWILKIIHLRNFSEAELDGVMKIFQDMLIDYLNSKKCRLKPDFMKEIIQRHPWIWHQLFGFLLEKCAGAKSEFRRVEALELVECVMKSCISTKKWESEKDISRKSKFLKSHLSQLCELIQKLLIKLPEKQSRRASIRRFCGRVFDAISVLNLNKAFLKSLNSDACAACESHLGNLFTAVKNPNKVDKSD